MPARPEPVFDFGLGMMPGDQARPNEDYAGVLGTCAVLIDGSGAPGDLPTGCIHGVPWFARQLAARLLSDMAAGDPGEGLKEVLASGIGAVARLHDGTCDLSAPGTPAGVLVMARAAAERLDWLVLGDCAIIIEQVDGRITMATDNRLDEVAPAEFQQVLSTAIGTAEHQAARVAFVSVQQPLRNKPGGYPLASADPAAAFQAYTGSVPVTEVRRAALASDGVTRFHSFGLGDWPQMLDVLAGDGPGGLFARIRAAENADPEGRLHPRAKRHDDVSVVFLQGIPGSSATAG